MLLKAQGITKRYGNNTVLQDAGFSVHEGEVLGLIGPNGAGKTTLFECLASLLPTDGGSVEFRGEALPAGHRKQALFYLPDGIRPWAHQPVEWVLAFFEAIYGRPQGCSAISLSQRNSITKCNAPYKSMSALHRAVA
jgi:ABC-2 type transport system ATP-binding protein